MPECVGNVSKAQTVNTAVAGWCLETFFTNQGGGSKLLFISKDWFTYSGSVHVRRLDYSYFSVVEIIY